MKAHLGPFGTETGGGQYRDTTGTGNYAGTYGGGGKR